MSHRRKQQGNLIIVVVFVLVVMGFLAASLSRIEQSNSDSHTKEVMGTQAALLAHSAIESALTTVYPPRANITDQFDVAAACTAIDGSNLSFETQVSCQNVQLACEQRGGTLVDDTQLFVIEAVSICGTGINQMQRRQEAWLRN
ncbi:MSHA biogenesis protein MshP [Vibrio maerlii]|uniref:MSHA biogenesis protein MshP n=1 Tax=Vibrio maerlii TaxID=2231648 RepID=UPI000E3C3497|nr:MSHA biogenesis protein MshP [Vibrio maerlii]